MPKNKFQDVIFTIIMATIMVYGMVVYNVALNTGTVNGTTFLAATHELPIMVPIAFVLEFFVVGKIAKMLACYASNRQTTVHHICNFNMYLLHYVSDYESCSYIPFQRAILWHVG